MYLTKPQYAAMLKINIGNHTDIAPEIIEFLKDNGQIIETLIGYEWTEHGKRSCDETYKEQQRQKADLKTGPSGKGDFFSVKRDSFSEQDDLTVIKRKPLDPVPKKAKPETKYK